MGQRLEEILEVAEGLFAKKGYHDTSMQDLGEALGLQRGSLYAHIRGKEDLLFAIVDRGADEFLAVSEPVMRLDAPADVRLKSALCAHVQVIARHLESSTVFFHEWKFLDGERRQEIARKRDLYESSFRQILEEGIQEGVFRPHDAHLSATLVLSAGNWFYQWYRPDGPLSAEEVANIFFDFLIGGLAKERMSVL